MNAEGTVNTNVAPSATPQAIPTVTMREKPVNSSPFNEAYKPYLAWASGLLIVVFLVIAILNWLRSRKRGERAVDVFRITNQPQTMFHYIGATILRHSVEYAFFVLLPLLVGIVAGIDLLSFLGLWGFLITTIGAFYAARADYSSTYALVEARKTYLSVINFADDLKSFIEKIKHDLDIITGDVTIKFLTVIPAFGTVGLEEYYADMKRFGAYREFHEYLADKVALSPRSNLDILTHNGPQTVDWIFNILNTGAKTNNQRTPEKLQALLQKTADLYLEQKKYVRELVGRWGPDKVRWRVWDTEKILGANNQPITSIPFQFLTVQHGRNRKVYFLFSGAYLYEFIFKSINVPVDMGALVALTKGYYIDRDEELLNIFLAIFDGLFEPLSYDMRLDQIDVNYPNRIDSVGGYENYSIDIEEKYTGYVRSRAASPQG